MHQRALRAPPRIETGTERSRPRQDEHDVYGNACLLANGAHRPGPLPDDQDLYGNACLAALAGDVREILGEQVVVSSDEEALEAQAIIERLESTYGLELSSVGVEAFLEKYVETRKGVPASRAAAYEEAPWTLTELRGLDTALTCFQPLFASGKVQGGGWLEIGKLADAMDYNLPGQPMESEIAPEWVRLGQTVSTAPAEKEGAVIALFKYGIDRVPKAFLSNVLHELTHALLRTRVPDWTSAFWKDGAWVGEKPPTSYASSSPSEDMSESFACWFTDKAKLGPQRRAWIEAEIATWKSPGAATA